MKLLVQVTTFDGRVGEYIMDGDDEKLYTVQGVTDLIDWRFYHVGYIALDRQDGGIDVIYERAVMYFSVRPYEDD